MITDPRELDLKHLARTPDGETLLLKRKRYNDNVTFVLTFHSASSKVFEITKTADRHIEKKHKLPSKISET